MKLRFILVPLLALLLVMAMTTNFFSQANEYKRDVIRVGLTIAPPVLDPQSWVALTGSSVYFNVFDTLILMDPKDNSKLIPELAKSWERISDTVLELKLRPNVLFHNGDPFTSADVKFSLERIYEDMSLSAHARNLLEVIERVETPDPLTVRIITDAPDPVLEYRLASLWGAWIVPKDYILEHGSDHFAQNPVGTGPFKVTNFIPEEIVELEAFEGYWREKPNVRRVIYRGIPEAGPRITALINEEVDIITPVPSDQIPLIDNYDHVGIQAMEQQLIHLLTYRMQSPFMQDEKLRQAMNLAIDREGIAAALWRGSASVPRGHQMDDYGHMYLEDHPIPEFNLEKAKQLVAESSYAGEVIYYDLIPNYYDNDIAAAEVIVESWRSIGLNAQIRLTSRFWENPDRAAHPWSYALRFPDPVGGLVLLWGEISARQAQGHHDWVDTDPRFNELGNKLSRTLDNDLRREYFQEMLEIYERQAPGTVLWRPAIAHGYNKDLIWNAYNTFTIDLGAWNLDFKN